MANNRTQTDGRFNYAYDDEGNHTRRAKISDGSGGQRGRSFFQTPVPIVRTRDLRRGVGLWRFHFIGVLRPD